ncbi:sensor histidine kinase [Kitasatospora viridis]|uniref:histidine kinase n=1 Tax=Kitasatospora viridis TaxID=281105 RepID=A0A561UPQ2_9ACTN|nr:histidine kinase [Kitasatospora viridis]TWG01321.1 signal transduction histidine kinase [Kitasatospora viridis]
MPRPPALRARPDFLTLLSWSAVPVFALVLLATTLWRVRPALFGDDRYLRVGPLPGLLLAVLLALPLGWAAKRAVPVLGLLLAETLTARLLGAKLWPLLLACAVLLFYVAAVRPRRTAAWSLVAVLAGWTAVQLLPPAEFAARVTGPSGTLVVVTASCWIAGSWLQLRQEHAATLRSQAAEQAVQAERLRIARELHDLVAHSIGAVAIQAGAARRVIANRPAEAAEALGAIEQTSRETLAGLRRMLGALRRADADPVAGAPAPGLADVERLAAAAGENGLRVAVSWHGERRPLAPEVELSAFRIIQEAVTNTMRHARAGLCTVSVDFTATELAVEVLDDGRGGGGGVGTGYGLIGMRERVGLLHGSLTAGPRPEGGFQVVARLPI